MSTSVQPLSSVAPGSLLGRVLAGVAPGESPLTHVASLPARGAVCVDWPSWASPSVVGALRAAGVTRPWSHQVAAASAAFEGRHVVLATGTASGKSLGYQLPVLTSLVDDRKATALYLSPTKALGADQLRFVAGLGLDDLRPAAFDGDTAMAERDWVRSHARWVFSNPDMLHRNVLPSHARWGAFLRRLRYVVLDECHAYRGVFGSHVALLLRRLRRLCARYGSSPVFVLASATVSSPAASASRLTGLPVVSVDTDGSPRVARTVALWEPPLLDELTGENGAPVRRSAGAETGRMLADLVVEGARTLAFVRSRRGAELTALRAANSLAEVDPSLAARVSAYRAGYLPEERRALEAALDSGELLGVASTNALELGIDVAGLDAVLVAGFPGTRASFWQQAGRAGRPTSSTPDQADGTRALDGTRELDGTRARQSPDEFPGPDGTRELDGTRARDGLRGPDGTRGLDGARARDGLRGPRESPESRKGRPAREALVVLVARDDPLDTYLVHHPEALLGRPVEGCVLDPSNPYVLAPQLACAAAESAITEAEVDTVFGGARARAVLDEMVADGVLRRRPAGWFWPRPTERPAAEVDIRGSGAGQVVVVEAETGRMLGTVDGGTAPVTVHPGAVYLHRGASFVVDELHLADGLALVHAEEPDWSTSARSVVDVAILDPPAPATEPVAAVPAPAVPVPAEPVPAAPVPAEPVPAETVPAETVPAETKAAAPVPAEPVPAAPVVVAPAELPDVGEAPTVNGTGSGEAAARSREVVGGTEPAIGPGGGVTTMPTREGVTVCLGEVTVTSQVVSYLRRRPSGEVIETVPLDLPAQTLYTRAVWYTIEESLLLEAGLDPARIPGALHAAEHAAIGLLPLFAVCDRWDIGGMSTALHPDTGAPTVFVHDGHPGGAGFAERGFAEIVPWLTATRAAIADCECPTGCPSCVQSPKCGNGNNPLDKAGAIIVLDLVLAACS